MMTFNCTLTCPGCKASLRYQDERPDWQTYDYRVEQADECERSARFVAEHADTVVGMYQPWPAYTDAGSPKFAVGRGALLEDPMPFGSYEGVRLSIPEPYRYVPCPVCDAHVKG